MSSKSFNAGIDYFNAETTTSGALKVTDSAENPSMQSTSGPNTFGDPIAVDAWGETAAPSSSYEVVDETTLDIILGKLIAAADSNIKINDTAVPVVVGSLSVSTQTGSAPTVTINGQAVHVDAVELRNYKLPTIALSPRHRAQDFLALCTIKKPGDGSTKVAADPGIDYGLSSVNGNFPIAFTLGQPKGELKSYDLHGEMVTIDFTMNWYLHGGTPDAMIEPTIECASTVTIPLSGNNTQTVPVTMTQPKAKTCPKDGYVQYTWQVSFPLIGFEVTP